jgi:RNA polymerase sigma-70 factor (ECF subfamily)
MNLHNGREIEPLLRKCIRGSRKAEHELYKAAFPYAMSIAIRYATSREESLEIVNEAFFKAFTYLHHFDPSQSFAAWLRRIVINESIDKYRSQLRQQELRKSYATEGADSGFDCELTDYFNAEELLFHIRQLPPSYRAVFCLYAIDGYSHKEIGEHLGISEGTSKSNYHKAREQLKQILIRAGISPKQTATP